MSTHSSVVFNNSCLKVPRNPINKQPLPVYDKKFLEQLQNCKEFNLSESERDQKDLEIDSMKTVDTKKTAKSLIEFYDSIPDYEEINHLPSNEFYKRLEYLKEKQRSYYDILDCEVKVRSDRNSSKIESSCSINEFNESTALKSRRSSKSSVDYTATTKKHNTNGKKLKSSIKRRSETPQLSKERLWKSEDDSCFSEKETCRISDIKKPIKKYNTENLINLRECETPILKFKDLKSEDEAVLFFSEKEITTENEGLNTKRYPSTPIPRKLTRDCKSEDDSVFYEQQSYNRKMPKCVINNSMNKDSTQQQQQEDLDSSSYNWEKEGGLKPPSRRSVRIETPSEADKTSFENTPEPAELFSRPKSRIDNMNMNLECKQQNCYWEEDADEEELKLNLPHETQSCPNSPIKNNNIGWKDTITIPKPFQMTIRDEENKIIDELLIHAKVPTVKESKHELFKANPVPIESQIPLFDKIMADQERRREKVKKRCKANLIAQMKPFTFTQREEEIQMLTKRLSKSTPSLCNTEEHELHHHKHKHKHFKAKPVPKNLFSDYVYQKMHEDEFYRALQRKIRAEEMLRASSLPPSMAKRERSGKQKPCICPRSYKDLGIDYDPLKKLCKSKNHFLNVDQELEELKKEFLGETGTPRRSTSRKSRRKRFKSTSSARSKSACQMRTPSVLDSVSRSNLAAILRIEAARKRMQDEMSRKLEEMKIKDEARWKEKVLRKRPVWQTLAYSHEEDLAMRLQLRKEEERLRNEEHRHRMQVMLGRVNQQPTLFERQSQVKYPKTREELIQSLYKELSSSSSDKCSTPSDIHIPSEKTYTINNNNKNNEHRHRERKLKDDYSMSSDNDTDIDDEDVLEDKRKE